MTEEYVMMPVELNDSYDRTTKAFYRGYVLLYGKQLPKDLSNERVEELEEVIHRLNNWCRAYPLDIFPEPDFTKAEIILIEGGMTLDAISASNMRHVINGVAKIIKPVLPKEVKYD